jgi:hypothetical protein
MLISNARCSFVVRTCSSSIAVLVVSSRSLYFIVISERGYNEVIKHCVGVNWSETYLFCFFVSNQLIHVSFGIDQHHWPGFECLDLLLLSIDDFLHHSHVFANIVIASFVFFGQDIRVQGQG